MNSNRNTNSLVRLSTNYERKGTLVRVVEIVDNSQYQANPLFGNLVSLLKTYRCERLIVEAFGHVIDPKNNETIYPCVGFDGLQVGDIVWIEPCPNLAAHIILPIAASLGNNNPSGLVVNQDGGDPIINPTDEIRFILPLKVTNLGSGDARIEALPTEWNKSGIISTTNQEIANGIKSFRSRIQLRNSNTWQVPDFGSKSYNATIWFQNFNSALPDKRRLTISGTNYFDAPLTFTPETGWHQIADFILAGQVIVFDFLDNTDYGDQNRPCGNSDKYCSFRLAGGSSLGVIWSLPPQIQGDISSSIHYLWLDNPANFTLQTPNQGKAFFVSEGCIQATKGYKVGGEGNDPTASGITATGLTSVDVKGGIVIGGTSGSGVGGVTDGDKGDITVSNSGTTWTIDPNSVTYDKIQQVSPQRLLGNPNNFPSQVTEIGLGAGLSFVGNTLTASGGGGGGASGTTLTNDTYVNGLLQNFGSFLNTSFGSLPVPFAVPQNAGWQNVISASVSEIGEYVAWYMAEAEINNPLAPNGLLEYRLLFSVTPDDTSIAVSFCPNGGYHRGSVSGFGGAAVVLNPGSSVILQARYTGGVAALARLNRAKVGIMRVKS